VVKNGWWFFHFNCLKCIHQSEGEVGSAGEQPASNKIDAYTEKEGLNI
jgi:hypothetical protein